MEGGLVDKQMGKIYSLQHIRVKRIKITIIIMLLLLLYQNISRCISKNINTKVQKIQISTNHMPT